MNTLGIDEAASMACTSLLPEKSKKRYEIAYNVFRNWCNTKNVNIHTSENVLLAYFYEKSEKVLSPASLWCEYSMLRSMISVNDDTDISKYAKLKAFLKNKNIGYRPKQSAVFSVEEVATFINEAPDQIYLLKKVVAIMGIAGACRKDELCKMTVDDVADKGALILVKIPDSKNHQSRSFTIVEDNFLQLVRKYQNLRPKMTILRRFFLRYQNGKCISQPVGRNSFAKIPCEIAKYLNLNNPENYTGHSFRRTSATLLANSGVDVLGLKRHGGWKSSTVAESYVAESLANKIDVANRIFKTNNKGASSSISQISASAVHHYEVDVDDST